MVGRNLQKILPRTFLKSLKVSTSPETPSYIIHFIARVGLLIDLLQHRMPTFLVVLNVVSVDIMDILIYFDGVAK